MRWITHIAFAYLMIKILEISLLVDLTPYYVWPILSLYAVMPDFDTFLGIKHRTYTHTPYAALLASLPLLINYELFLVGFTAYMSHLVTDMLNVSGLKLLYPKKQTIYYFLPPAWRIRTGSHGEFAILAIVILLTASFTLTASTTELDKIFMYRKSNDIWVEISFYENGVLKSYSSKKVVWDNGNNQIGILEDDRLRIIDKGQISHLKIIAKQKVNRHESERRVVLKRLKVRDELVTSYNKGYGWIDFLGSGEDLYFKLYNGSNEDMKLRVRMICST